MKKSVLWLALVAGVAFVWTPMASQAECKLSYARTACKGKEADSFKKCDGKAECVQVKEAASEAACLEAAKKACDNDRTDITKFKQIAASWSGKALVGGFDAKGQADAAGTHFCAANRPDMNKCE
ncbi:MAG: hypothetical protein HQL56_11640 [Magnetococcales bacterium]|nr:hypothetical protein [Magnetococcales bacterium]